MKAELAGIAGEYAQAVLELALTAGGDTPEVILEDLEAINNVIADNPDFAIVLKHPGVPGPDKKKLLAQLFENKAYDLTLRLLSLLADKRRLGLLPYIEVRYRQLLYARKNIVTGTLISAESLSDAAVERIRSQLSRQLGKEVMLDAQTDRSLIGGIILRLGDQVIDGSLRGRLQALEKTLLSV